MLLGCLKSSSLPCFSSQSLLSNYMKVESVSIGGRDSNEVFDNIGYEYYVNCGHTNEMKMWSSQLWLRFKQSQSKPEKCFFGLTLRLLKSQSILLCGRRFRFTSRICLKLCRKRPSILYLAKWNIKKPWKPLASSPCVPEEMMHAWSSLVKPVPVLHLTELFPVQSLLSKLMTCATLVPGPCWGERTDSMTS